MALLKYDPLATKVRGSISEVTFSKARAGETVRARTYPFDPYSMRQAPYRQRFTEAHTFWADSISPAQKAVWNTLGDNTDLYNSAGDLYHPSGLNLALGHNAFFDMCSQSMISTAPAAARFDAPGFDDPGCFDAWTALMDNTAWSDPLTGWVYILESPALSPGIFSYTGPWEETDLHTITEFHSGAPVYLNTRVSWIVGKKYFWQIKAIQTLGCLSFRTILSAICETAP